MRATFIGMAATALMALLDAGCSNGITTGDSSIPVDASSSMDQSAVFDSFIPVDAGVGDANDNGCLPGMARIGTFCVDRWEGHIVELDDGGVEHPHSPFVVVGAATVRAKTAAGVMPQGYISQIQATAACNSAGKRLCTSTEFALACRGPDPANEYPYGGKTHVKGNCNEGKGSSMPLFFGSDATKWTYAEFNDPRLNQWDGGLAPTGAYPKCVSPEGVFDCVGNLHEWGSDAADAKGHGRFRGGFYGDAEINGPGCLYVTSAHELAYHDYSTGFRCCMDATH